MVPVSLNQRSTENALPWCPENLVEWKKQGEKMREKKKIHTRNLNGLVVSR